MTPKSATKRSEISDARNYVRESGLLGKGYREVMSCIQGETFVYFFSPSAARKAKVDSIREALRIPRQKQFMYVNYSTLQALEEKVEETGLNASNISDCCVLVCIKEESAQLELDRIFEQYKLNLIDLLFEQAELETNPNNVIHLSDRQPR